MTALPRITSETKAYVRVLRLQQKMAIRDVAMATGISKSSVWRSGSVAHLPKSFSQEASESKGARKTRDINRASEAWNFAMCPKVEKNSGKF